jgi:GNAT superfamily N-acetyltransferase
MKVVTATGLDTAAWLELAASVEHLFGPMAREPGFHAALARNLARGTALCIRRGDGAAGTPLDGGLLFSTRAGSPAVGWLAVAEARRGRGVGTALMAEALRRFVSFPCVVEVETFGDDHPGRAARRFYERLGFEAGPAADPGPEGGSRQWFIARYERAPDWLDTPISR